ncbi:hypothetical protein OPT61_g5568 [Boeremia exigua]|uniref:Uncharacterized protein n=1 Tax=Boeremia exigua TaxID=749465 RepID=A0ACC2I9U8_9PLEO|nr:hypothetical protein OPT61_g5568 [Boeremia exigua]
MGARSDLSSELTRIIECPYPASLSKLKDLLTCADTVTIQACIHDRSPCAVTRLATLVCDALPLWAYTSHVLQFLCCSVEFTERLLQQSPGLLNALLTKATSSQRDFDDYLGLCVRLLSRPLPESVPLPASAQSFFLRVFQRATQSPDVSTLQPVYSMLNGACRKLLGLLPSDVRQQFDRELCHILSSNGTGQNSMLLLWCFGIVILAEHPEELSDTDYVGPTRSKTSTGLERQWKTASGRKLFGTTNGIYKTLNLTYLSVIWATKGDVGVSDTEAIEGIRIAVRTLRFVDVEARAGWPSSSALAKNIFPKLPAKILREDIHPTVQLEALCFFATIAGATNLPIEIVAQYQDCLARLEGRVDVGCLYEILAISLPIFAPQMQDSLLRTLLSDTLDACITSTSSRPLNHLVALIDSLFAVSSGCPALSSKLLSALASSPLQSKIWTLVRTDATNSSVGCNSYATALHGEAVAAMISLLLNLAIAAKSQEPFLPQSLTTALVMKQRKLPQVLKQCSHTTSIPNGPSISLFQQESTPFTGQHLQDWRDRLKSELESQNSYQHDSIVRSVAQICQDLELRCNTVEEPLRREKIRSQELELRVEKLREQVSSLESQAADDRFHLDGLEDEKLGLADEKDRVSAKLDELQLQFEESIRHADEALRGAQENFNARELELRSTVLDHEEQLRTREDEIQVLNSTVSQVRTSYEHTEEELRALGERYEDLQARLGHANCQLDEEREGKARQSEEITKLKERTIALEDQLQTAESELETISGQLSNLQVCHQELKQCSEDALKQSEIKHTKDLEVAAARAEEERNKLHSKLTDTLQTSQQLQDAYDKTCRELHALQNTCSGLETRIHELDTLCGEQEEELEELRTLRRNVLASMGLATQKPPTGGSASRASKAVTVPETPRAPPEHRRRKSAIQTQDLDPRIIGATHGIDDTPAEHVAQELFDSSGHDSQNGSTPKRQKPRSSVKMTTMQTPFDRRPTLASRSTSKKLSPIKRSALRQMSPNRRHTTVGFALSEHEDQRQTQEVGSAAKRPRSYREASQEDFDMDDFLAGTPFTPGAFASGTGRLPEEDEATTTELRDKRCSPPTQAFATADALLKNQQRSLVTSPSPPNLHVSHSHTATKEVIKGAVLCTVCTMQRQYNNRPPSGFRGRNQDNNGSADGLAKSSSSSGSGRQAGLARPVIRPSSNPINRVRTPNQPQEGYSCPDSPMAPGAPVSELSSFTLNGQQINETYKQRLSTNTSPQKPSPPTSPASRAGGPRHRANSQYPPTKPATRNTQGHWALQQVTKLKILGLPKRCWTKDVYFLLSRFGTVVKIDMEAGSRDNNAYVVFQPPLNRLPSQLQIGGDAVRYEIRQPLTYTVDSPVNPVVKYQELNVLFADSLNFGIQNGEKTLITKHEIRTKGEVQVTLDLRRKELEVKFPLKIDGQYHKYSLRLPISQLSGIHKTVNGNDTSVLTIPFGRSPQFFVQKKPTKEEGSSFSLTERTWSEWSTMFRETDVVDDRKRKEMQTMPVIDHKGSAIIDIGRWTTYCLTFNNDALFGPKFDEFRNALGDFGVMMRDSEQFTILSEEPSSLIEMLGQEYTDSHSHLHGSQKTSVLDDLALDRIYLAFPVRYQLEACLSNNLIKESSVTREFLEKLLSMNSYQAIDLLEKVVDKQHVYYNPMDIFKLHSKVTRQKPIPKHCVMQRSVNITPTMMHVASPIMEISNRITRQYYADADRFIRVKFSDEKGDGALRSMPGGRADALFNRVSRAMKNGIVVAGRYYEFLAFGNSQFREHGAYFYAPTSTKSAHDIRVTLGQFDHIKTVAKYGARLGQCFSTTRAMQTTVVVRKIPDVERNGYTFTDGVGRLSFFLAQMAAQDLGLQNAFEDPPSLYQFRLGGCKGVLALDPSIVRNEVHIRPSQFKFEAPYTGLEIIRCSSLATPFFNRQIIIVLSDLGVLDHVFIRKQQQMVNAYELAMTDKTEALSCLLKHIDINQTTLTMASMVLDGFLEGREPFMMSLLHLWRASTIKELKKKARIAIAEGAFVLGCIDESSTLLGHRNDPQSQLNADRNQKLDTLPEIFIQIDDTSRKGHYKVIEGVCVLARNPSLHPGDIRVVRAVDAPALHHHKNVVVLPQTGDRDLANMCSGGDLDGDDYMVLWDQELIPQIVNVPPMDYTPEKPIESTESISIADVGDFFVAYMKNDSLGQIAHAHLAQADSQPEGVASPTCIELARLHSQSVDYPKSGIPAIMDNALRPRKWPHFMEKRHKGPEQTYQSKNILGMLYDQVQLIDFNPVWEDNFDRRILDHFTIETSLLKKAADIKAEYDNDLRRMMAKHGVGTEFEAFSTFVLTHNQETRDYKFAEEFGRTVGVFKAQYRQACMKASGATSVTEWDLLGPFVAAMYSVTADEMRSALKECSETKVVGGQSVSVRKKEAEHMPLMSFPWLFHTELGKLATGNTKSGLAITQAQRPQNRPTRGIEKADGVDVMETDGSIIRFGDMLTLDFEEVQKPKQQQEDDKEEDEGAQGKSHTGSPPGSPWPTQTP